MTQPAAPPQPDEQRPHVDRLNGPGWNDWCYTDSTKTAAPDAWDGDDVIDTTERRRHARDGWHRIICTRLHYRNGATLDQLERDPRMAWFHLRLTRNEIASLLWSASAAGLVTRRPSDPDNLDDVLAHGDLTWLCTEGATKDKTYVEPPRVGRAKDMLRHATPAAASAKAIAGAVVALAGAVTAFATTGTVADPDALLYSTTGLLAAAVAACGFAARATLLEQRTLAAMIDAWERGKVYRPKRAEFEQNRLREPLPVVVVTLVLALAPAAGAYLWYDRGKIGDTGEALGLGIAIAFAVPAVIAYAYLAKRVRPRRQALTDEHLLRANPPRRPRDVLRPLPPR